MKKKEEKKIMKEIKIPTVRKSMTIHFPTYARLGDSGADVRSRVLCDIPPGESRLIPTGLCVAVPEGYELQIRPRSGLALNHGVTVLNTPVTIDSGYRGEIGIILINHGKDTFLVRPETSISQLVLVKVEKAKFVEVETLPESERGEGGFGSTDAKIVGGESIAE